MPAKDMPYQPHWTAEAAMSLVFASTRAGFSFFHQQLTNRPTLTSCTVLYCDPLHPDLRPVVRSTTQDLHRSCHRHGFEDRSHSNTHSAQASSYTFSSIARLADSSAHCLIYQARRRSELCRVYLQRNKGSRRQYCDIPLTSNSN